MKKYAELKRDLSKRGFVAVFRQPIIESVTYLLRRWEYVTKILHYLENLLIRINALFMLIPTFAHVNIPPNMYIAWVEWTNRSL